VRLVETDAAAVEALELVREREAWQPGALVEKAKRS
jgi:hypothetical protein